VKKLHTTAGFILLLVTGNTAARARSPFRTPDPLLPSITVRWAGEKQDSGYTHYDSHIEPYPAFLWTMHDIELNLLPSTPIRHRINTNNTSNGHELSTLIENLLTEIRDGKKRFTDFKLIQKKNFNSGKRCGLIVLKFKKHPFVLKLFMEQPNSFADPYGKGVEPISFFFMAGGANRHMSGLTRVRNAQYAKQKIDSLTVWHKHIFMPRKWFWLPQENRLLHITGHNIGGKTSMENEIPSVYGIIADYIETDKRITFGHRKRKAIAMRLCNDLNLCIDPHGDNFIFVLDEAMKKPKIAIIDTEHFPTIVGLKKRRSFRTHRHWIAFLVGKYVRDTYCRTKSMRRYAQIEPRELDII